MSPRSASEQRTRGVAAHTRSADKYIGPPTMAGGIREPYLDEKLAEETGTGNGLNWFDHPKAASDLSSQESLCTDDSALDETGLYAYHPNKSSVWDDDTSAVQPLCSNSGEALSLHPPKPTTKYPTPLNPSESKSAIEDILETFDLISATFVWPDRLDFLPTQVGCGPELANTRHNAPWIEQQGRLLSLAVELEYIPTYGSANLRNVRAEATGLVRKELCKLDAFKTKLWEQYNREPLVTRRQAFWKWLTTVEWD
ncbi:hypothetical protein FRC10_002507 [Ceratobasidium sp. 414]|nr:hypothetical protein FRC10_002507 [Ceratobasidium sp. 414]